MSVAGDEDTHVHYDGEPGNRVPGPCPINIATWRNCFSADQLGQGTKLISLRHWPQEPETRSVPDLHSAQRTPSPACPVTVWAGPSVATAQKTGLSSVVTEPKGCRVARDNDQGTTMILFADYEGFAVFWCLISGRS